MSDENTKKVQFSSDQIIHDIKLTTQLSLMGIDEILEFCIKEHETHKLFIACGYLSKLLQESNSFSPNFLEDRILFFEKHNGMKILTNILNYKDSDLRKKVSGLLCNIVAICNIYFR